MNKRRTNEAIKRIENYLKLRNARVRKNFGVNVQQLEMADRIQSVREVIDSVPNEMPLAVYGNELDITYLLRLTELHKKNICFFIDDGDSTTVRDIYHGNREYEVKKSDAAAVMSASCILIADMDGTDAFEKRLRAQGYRGEVKSIYTYEERIPFYCIAPHIAVSRRSPICEKLENSYIRVADDYELGIMGRIDRINEKLQVCRGKKVIIYAAGDHTLLLVRYTDMKYMNVIGVADRSVREYHGIAVIPNDFEHLNRADHIVISSYVFQGDILSYLQSIGLGEKALALYDDRDVCEFFENPNGFGSDLAYERDIKQKNYELSTVYRKADELGADIFRNSDRYLTWRLWEDCNNTQVVSYEDEEEVISLKGYRASNEKFAIVIQGPVIYDHDFTLKSIWMYKRLYPGVRIILSTWRAETYKREFDIFRSLDIELVFSEAPEIPGPLNLNFQIRSTHAGLKRAAKLGCRYSMKFRTDMRMYAKDCFRMAETLLTAYPAAAGGMQDARLIILPPHMDTGYFIPDYFMAGSTKELLRFWEGEEDAGGDVIMNPEMTLFSRYFKRIGRYIEEPVREIDAYARVLFECFIVMDVDFFQVIWKKYTFEALEGWSIRENRLNFTDWLSHQTGGQHEDSCAQGTLENGGGEKPVGSAAPRH